MLLPTLKTEVEAVKISLLQAMEVETALTGAGKAESLAIPGVAGVAALQFGAVAVAAGLLLAVRLVLLAHQPMAGLDQQVRLPQQHQPQQLSPEADQAALKMETWARAAMAA